MQPQEDRQQKIVAMFDSIASKYDIANRVMSCGVDISWRKKACELAFSTLRQNNTPITIADVACGSGDMILHWQRNANSLGIPLDKIIGLDPSSKMLEMAGKKLPQTVFYQCEANALTLENESVDILSIAYGLRNVLALNEALSEFYRVLKNNGILVILEFTKNTHPTLKEKLMGFYSRKILPIVGGMVTNNFKAYYYLPNSIDEFLSAEELSRLLELKGFKLCHLQHFSAKICSLFIAQKLLKE